MGNAYALGIHSNIPECCVQSFVFLGLTGDKMPPDVPGINYVRCAECRKTDRREMLHFCDEKCIPFLESIGYERFAESLTEWGGDWEEDFIQDEDT